MLFNSLQFLLFLSVVFGLYWFVFNRNRMAQNAFLVLASFVFYGWWDWRFTLLLAFVILWTWGFALVVGREGDHRKAWMIVGIIGDLALLGFFKYYNFFFNSTVDLLRAIGFNANPSTLKILLPVGISFYSFQAVGYLADVYLHKIAATRDLVTYAASVSFFPKLAMGPIERSVDFIPQFLKPRTFEYPKAVDGCRQILWGLFKKMVVADNCAVLSNYLVQTGSEGRWITTLLAMFAYTIQIYADFSGYSDMAIGIGRLFGFNITRNFAFPYFSRNVAEFWRRWHISLMTWLRDYIYIPLGGSRCSKTRRILNTFAVFLVSGLWHGANWTFILWGFVHACCFLPLLLLGSNHKYEGVVAQGRRFPSFGELWRMGVTFLVVMFCWAIFLAPNITTAMEWFKSIATFSGGMVFAAVKDALPSLKVIPWVFLMVTIEYCNRDRQYGCARYPQNRIFRWACYGFWVSVITVFHAETAVFIYFKF